MAKSLRAEMPETAAFIDSLREAFGAPMIDAAIKAGINGQPTFWASENGHEIGTKSKPHTVTFTADQLVITPRQPKVGRK